MTEQYYIIENNEQLGPFSIEELKQKEINNTTLVWKSGLVDWVVAGSLEELKFIFRVMPPPIPKEKNTQVILKTKEPLLVEDIVRKEELEKHNIRIQKSKTKTANEIKRIYKYLKIGLITSISTLIISFGILDGYRFLYYYFQAGGNFFDSCVENQSEIKFVGPCESWTDFTTKMESNNGLPESFQKWSKLLGLQYWTSEDSFKKSLDLPVNWLVRGEFTPPMSEHKLVENSKYITALAYYSYFKDKNGEELKSIPFENMNLIYRKDFDILFSNGKIIRKITVDFQITTKYGKYIVDNLSFAWNKSLIYSLIAFAIIFPISYFILLILGLFEKSKFWINENLN